MDHLRLQSAFKFVAISRFGDGGQLMTAANLCLEAVQNFFSSAVIYHTPTTLFKFRTDYWSPSEFRHLPFKPSKTSNTCV